jgi:hypothetical protein
VSDAAMMRGLMIAVLQPLRAASAWSRPEGLHSGRPPRC